MSQDAPSSTDAAVEAGPKRPRRRWIVVVLVSAFVVLYALVLVLYALSGRVGGVSSPKEPPPGGLTVVLSPESVDASGQRIAMTLQIDPSKELETEDGLSLKKTVAVVVAPSAGDQAITFAAGAVPSTATVHVITDGSIENWPFDVYKQEPLYVLAYTTNGSERVPVQIYVDMRGYVPGWSLSGALMKDEAISDAPAANAATAAVISIQAERSWSTLAFGTVLLALLIVMPCLVLFVAIKAYRGRRKVEATFMSWMGAMLFATIPLRTFLPGAPPIGSWIDFTIVLWVVVGLVTGLVIFVAAWWRWGTRGERAEQ